MTELSTTLTRVRDTLVPAFEADLRARRSTRPRVRWFVATIAAVAVTGGAVAVADNWVGPPAPAATQREFFGTVWPHDVAPVGPVIEAARDERHVLFAAPARGGGYCTAVRDVSGASAPTSSVFCKTPDGPGPGEIRYFGGGSTENPEAAAAAQCEDDPSTEAETACSYPPDVVVHFVDQFLIGQVSGDQATRIEITLPNGLPPASAAVGVDGLFVVDLPVGYGALVKSDARPGPAVAYDRNNTVVARMESPESSVT